MLGLAVHHYLLPPKTSEEAEVKGINVLRVLGEQLENHHARGRAIPNKVEIGI
jgi:hypothetical protein